MSSRIEFRNDIRQAVFSTTRPIRSRIIYGVIAKYDWEVSVEELEFIVEITGYKRGWVYYHTGPRLADARLRYESSPPRRAPTARPQPWQRPVRRAPERGREFYYTYDTGNSRARG